jgi:hypothetical protein
VPGAGRMRLLRYADGGRSASIALSIRTAGGQNVVRRSRAVRCRGNSSLANVRSWL